MSSSELQNAQAEGPLNTDIEFRAAEVSADQQRAIDRNSAHLAHLVLNATETVVAAQGVDLEDEVHQATGLNSETAGHDDEKTSIGVEHDATFSMASLTNSKIHDASHMVFNIEGRVSEKTGRDVVAGTSTTRELIYAEDGTVQVETVREITDDEGRATGTYTSLSSNPRYVEKVQDRIIKETTEANEAAKNLINDYDTGVAVKNLPK